MAVIPTRVAEMWRSAPTISPKGTIAPRTTTQRRRAQTGRCREARCPSRETRSSTRAPGKFHHGAATVQKTVAERELGEPKAE
jgi:hypothetical protein